MPHLVSISFLLSNCPNGFYRSPINLIPLLNQALFFVQHFLELYHMGIAHASVKLEGYRFTIKSSMAGM